MLGITFLQKCFYVWYHCPMKTLNHALFVFTKKTAWMQRISDVIRTGHHEYIFGQISLEKSKFLAEKFSKHYDTGLSKLEQSRKRKKGEASFRWLAWLDENTTIVHWVLCKTTGKVPDEALREKWQDATSKTRLHVVGGYELVRLTKPEEPKPTWTWRYSKSHYEGLRDSLIRAIRNHRDDELRQLIHDIWRTPGFSGARDQVKQIKTLIKAEWKRSRGSDPLPEIPERIGYVRRLSDMGKVLK